MMCFSIFGVWKLGVGGFLEAELCNFKFRNSVRLQVEGIARELEDFIRKLRGTRRRALLLANDNQTCDLLYEKRGEGSQEGREDKIKIVLRNRERRGRESSMRLEIAQSAPALLHPLVAALYISPSVYWCLRKRHSTLAFSAREASLCTRTHVHARARSMLTVSSTQLGNKFSSAPLSKCHEIFPLSFGYL